jgi:predicted Fe-S protein YdhL (DUF1289 family)
MSRCVIPKASSPCIKVCVIDPVTKLCSGCGRSLSEIGLWSRLSEPERIAIMAHLPARMAAMAKPSAAPALTR